VRVSGSFPGVYRAVVTDAQDPQQRGRVEIEVPEVSAQQRSWAPVLAPGRATFAGPERGDAVLVAFEAGDPDRPVVLGLLPNRV
jgi:uncharacterized protein involved in type VI secretion and phage assembly